MTIVVLHKYHLKNVKEFKIVILILINLKKLTTKVEFCCIKKCKPNEHL